MENRRIKHKIQDQVDSNSGLIILPIGETKLEPFWCEPKTLHRILENGGFDDATINYYIDDDYEALKVYTPDLNTLFHYHNIIFGLSRSRELFFMSWIPR